MNKNILKTGVQEFIEKNKNADIVSVLLKKPLFAEASNKELAQQIQSRKKSEKKLPTWFKTKKIYFPKPLNLEQSSSEITAKYKAEIVAGESLFDLTGGFGIDSYYFGQKINAVVHCELDQELSQIVRHNFKILQMPNIKVVAANGLEYLEKSKRKWDWIYIDPSRRDEAKGKVVHLVDCLPDVPSNLKIFLEKSNNILLKTSPLLDVQVGISSLSFVKEIHIVAVENEVKELLWVISKGFRAEPLIKTVNLNKTGRQEFSFLPSEEKKGISDFSLPLSFLYEPNAALMKSGAFKLLGQHFNMFKLHRHTHLYTSDTFIPFPGRTFEIEKLRSYNTKSIKNLNVKKANVSTRNFHESVAQIRKKHSLKDGGDVQLYFCKTFDEKMRVIQCKKWSSLTLQ